MGFEYFQIFFTNHFLWFSKEKTHNKIPLCRKLRHQTCYRKCVIRPDRDGMEGAGFKDARMSQDSHSSSKSI